MQILHFFFINREKDDEKVIRVLGAIVHATSCTPRIAPNGALWLSERIEFVV